MNILRIKQRGPRASLFNRCTPITDLESERDWILQLIRLVIKNELEGLSANQAGINKQVFVTDVRGDGIRIYINPTLTIIDFDQKLVRDKCFSYPSVPYKRYRHTSVIVEAQSFDGSGFILDTTESKYNGDVAIRLAARIQHEMEHMHGIDVLQEPNVGDGQKALADLSQKPVYVPAL